MSTNFPGRTLGSAKLGNVPSVTQPVSGSVCVDTKSAWGLHSWALGCTAAPKAQPLQCGVEWGCSGLVDTQEKLADGFVSCAIIKFSHLASSFFPGYTANGLEFYNSNNTPCFTYIASVI